MKKLTRKQLKAIKNTSSYKYFEQLKTLKGSMPADSKKTYIEPNSDLEKFAKLQVMTLNKYIRQDGKGHNLAAQVLQDLQQQACLLILENPLSLDCFTTEQDKQTEQQQQAFKAVKNGLYRYYYHNYTSRSTSKIHNNPSSYIATATYQATDDIGKDARDSYQMDLYKLHLDAILTILTTDEKYIFNGLFVENLTQKQLAEKLNKSQTYVAKTLANIRSKIKANDLDTPINN